MVKVITYGTYDLLHYGHIRLLERAKALGDYLIVGVTADDFDKTRGKINVQQSLIERVDAVRATGIADEIIVEEYEGQKIDDIKKYDIDIFTVGSDWTGKFDYLNEYCKVVYLPRTEGVSSSELRTEKREIRLGLVGNAAFLNKVLKELTYVNGIKVCSVFSTNTSLLCDELRKLNCKTYQEVFLKSDAIYIRTIPDDHFESIKLALENKKHVICESPIASNVKATNELFKIAQNNNVILMESIKTAYATAFNRLLLLIKCGKIGKVVSIDSVCTSLEEKKTEWNGFDEWAPTGILPVVKILGDKIESCESFSKTISNKNYARITLNYKDAIATVSVGDAIKSEGHLIISGTCGYIYVPSPWWKTDYFEIRHENPNLNRRYFYSLDGEGIRQQFVTFLEAISKNSYKSMNISKDEILFIEMIMQNYRDNEVTLK